MFSNINLKHSTMQYKQVSSLCIQKGLVQSYSLGLNLESKEVPAKAST